MIKLKDLLKETDVEDFIIQTMVPKGTKMELFRYIALSPAGNEIRTGWYTYGDRLINDVKRELQTLKYKIVKMEKKTEIV